MNLDMGIMARSVHRQLLIPFVVSATVYSPMLPPDPKRWAFTIQPSFACRLSTWPQALVANSLGIILGSATQFYTFHWFTHGHWISDAIVMQSAGAGSVCVIESIMSQEDYLRITVPGGANR